MSQSVVNKVVRRETSRRERTRDKSAVCFEYTDKEGEEKRVRIARDVDPSYTDAITASEPNARDYSDALPELPLPGSGETLNDCGEEFPGLFCTGCGAPHSVGRTCRRSRCPRCWQSWAFHRAKSITSKIEALGRHMYTQEDKQVKQHHLTVSPRDSTRFNSKDPLKQGVEAIKPLLSKVDVDTGYLIYHPYRIAPVYRGDVLGHESGDGDMTWKDVLAKVEDDAWTWEAVREEFLEYAPHFHVICLSEFVDTTGVGKIEEQTGVVIHRITTKRDDGKERSIDSPEELCRATAYSLSHSGLAPEDDGETYRAAARPFGRVANFEAWDGVKADIDDAMRGVAGKVLGVEFADPECNEPLVGCDHDHTEGSPEAGGVLQATRYLTGDGGADGHVAAAPGSDDDVWVPPSLNQPTEGQTPRCDGDLAPMWKATTHLGDIRWINQIEDEHGEERLHELRKAHEEYQDMGSPRPPEVDPPGE